MFADKKPDLRHMANFEDVSREDIVAAFRLAMIGHFRSHVPGTNVNEATLIASDYLNHFHELVMLLEAIGAEPKEFADDLLSWRPLTYEEHFSRSRASADKIRHCRLSPSAAPHQGPLR